MTPEAEEQVLRDLGALRGFMEDSVRLRIEDREHRMRRQNEVDERMGAMQRQIDTVNKRVNEWAVVVRTLKAAAAVVVLIVTLNVGDLWKNVKGWFS